MNRKFGIVALIVAFSIAWSCLPSVGAADKKPAEAKKDRVVERTRKTVRMLDDVYKSAVVLITEHYVNDEDDLPAGSAAIALFDAVKKKGWHEVKLLDVSGDPYDDKNTAKDAFELEAVKRMKAGEKWYDQVVGEKKDRKLRVATPVPVVLEKCIMCHAHYKDFKDGAAIGMLSYTIPIE